MGYYSRARNLHLTSKYIAKELNGVFPKSYKDLIQLKGVGDYTASAIASICYEEKTAVVDGNVYRVLSRFFGIDTPINSTQGVKQFKTLASSLLPKTKIGDYNQAIMEFGAHQCKPKSPDCSICPLANDCVAYNTGKITILPTKLNKTKIKKRYLNFLVLKSIDGKTILEQRTSKGIWQNLYQFPLFETSEKMTKADLKLNQNHIKTKDLIIETVDLFDNKEVVHRLSHQELHIKFWILNTRESLKEGVLWSEISKYAVPTVIDRFINKFQS